MFKAAIAPPFFLHWPTMRILAWVVRISLFVMVFGLAIKNSDSVVVRFFFESQWEVPLVLLVLAAFCAGALLSLFATVLMRTEVRLLEAGQISREERRSAGHDSSQADLYP